MDLKSHFPVLSQQVHGKRLVYLDSAATALKPLSVVEAERAYELEYCANIHRGVHALSERATAAYEGTRDRLKTWLNAKSRNEIIFTTGTTGGVNLVAYAWGRKFLKAGDEIWISSLEHHSNIVPWQVLCEQLGCVLRVIPWIATSPTAPRNDDSFVAIQGLTSKAKLLAVSYGSNAIGKFNPLSTWISQAKAQGMTVLVDAAQAAPHTRLDVQALGADFVVFSGHKVYGPTGTGVLWGREEILNTMQPYQTGGDMIESVSFEKTTYAKLPSKFEAGTPNISGVIGLGAAIDWVEQTGMDAIAQHERALAVKTYDALSAISGVTLHSPRGELPIVSWTMKGVHPHDVATIMDQEGIAIRAGHLCAQPLLKLLGVSALSRASFGVYNTEADIDALTAGIARAKQVFRC